ncbi:DUF2490 domain-containing protein [Legionella fallonii]|uniref:DUF2490 domain-containing protein n=1 Tax=Legionella fallonii LLAP-10 TaxID=1212491 RepID=A0A098G0W7_9GAMM|nr:DUF2490 domain-containing protein [Legionella fallonii]CEG56113.1 conserved protein of unknown function [Legionella fallonii LLAP-10]
MPKVKCFFWIKVITSFFLSLVIYPVNATRTYTKDWSVANIIAPLSEGSSFKYYLEPQLRLIDTRSVFNQFLFLGGLGYQFNPDLMLFIGPGWIEIKNPINNTSSTEKRLWQQLNWRILNNSNLTLNSRTRLEERNHTPRSQIAFRLRQRLWFRVPLQQWSGYSFSFFDEIFFNLNHPSWTSPYLLEQNRAFIGMAKQLSKSAILDVGYLHQYLHSFTNQSDNVLLLSLTMIT